MTNVPVVGTGRIANVERIRCEAEAIGVSLNTEKTRIVTISDDRAVFSFLGFEFRWLPSLRTGKGVPVHDSFASPYSSARDLP